MTQDNPHELKFATKFPDWHPRKGEPTYFARAINNGLYWHTEQDTEEQRETGKRLKQFPNPNGGTMDKIHTARKGHDWKVGDWFRPVTPDGVQIAPAVAVDLGARYAD